MLVQSICAKVLLKLKSVGGKNNNNRPNKASSSICG